MLVGFLVCSMEATDFCQVCKCFGGIVKCENAGLTEIPDLIVGQRPTMINFKSNPNLKCADIEKFRETTGFSIFDDCELTTMSTQVAESASAESASINLVALTYLTVAFGLIAVGGAIVGIYFMYRHHKLLRNIANDIRLIRQEQVDVCDARYVRVRPDVRVRPELFHDIARPMPRGTDDQTVVKEVAGPSGTVKSSRPPATVSSRTRSKQRQPAPDPPQEEEVFYDPQCSTNGCDSR